MSGHRGGVHHVELWVPDLEAAERSWGWLLGGLGWTPYQRWDRGRSWRCGGSYLVVERSPALTGGAHERTRAGMNHLALHAGSRAQVDRLVADCAAYGWSLLFPDRHPWAGGPAHYAAYLADSQGFEVELVADG